MGIRLGLTLLLLALASSALLTESSSLSLSSSSSSMEEPGFGIIFGGGPNNNTCKGLIGDCIDEEEEMMLDSEASRRQLAGRRARISRDAMRRSATPCGRAHRGGRYYGCPPATANPYRRGCSRITMCQRNVR